jgi:hypothetical protein
VVERVRFETVFIVTLPQPDERDDDVAARLMGHKTRAVVGRNFIT